MNISKQLFLLALGVIVLSGCAQKPVSTSETSTIQHQIKLTTFNNWQIKARVSIKTKDDAFTASLLWQQQPANQIVELNGMLGQNYARIEVTPEHASLRIQDNPIHQARQVEDLMMNHLGYIIPVTAMTNWLKGSTAGVAEEQWSINEAGYIAELRDRGWRITYKRYASFPDLNDLQLPSRLTLTNGQETIKIAVQSWSQL
ncbi:MAG: lipoprotein insertase outer membrane protein LolB [Gammaproteobacteria bacterium]|nr:lipoprotein insertase outer membrane protein LolB [Gammaproteobacteria bacterium]NNJ72413.1 outer membrane lipoprotein LolB [Enterobacterales bacterium]